MRLHRGDPNEIRFPWPMVNRYRSPATGTPATDRLKTICQALVDSIEYKLRRDERKGQR